MTTANYRNKIAALKQSGPNIIIAESLSGDAPLRPPQVEVSSDFAHQLSMTKQIQGGSYNLKEENFEKEESVVIERKSQLGRLTPMDTVPPSLTVDDNNNSFTPTHLTKT
jgi:hypothetical protein